MKLRACSILLIWLLCSVSFAEVAVSSPDDKAISIAEDLQGAVWVGFQSGGLMRFDPDSKICERKFSTSLGAILAVDPDFSENLLLLLTKRRAIVIQKDSGKKIAQLAIDSPLAYLKLGPGVFSLSGQTGVRFFSISDYSLTRNAKVWSQWKSISRNVWTDSAFIDCIGFSSLLFDTLSATLYAKTNEGVFAFSPTEHMLPTEDVFPVESITVSPWRFENGELIKESSSAPPTNNFVADTIPTQAKIPSEKVGWRINNVWFWIMGVLVLAGIMAAVYYAFGNWRGEKQRPAVQSAQPFLAAQSTPAAPSVFHLAKNLQSIQDFVLKGEKVMAYEMLDQFKQLLELNFSMAGKKEVQIAEELNFLNLYLQLEQSRLNGKLEYTIKVEDNVSQKRTIKPLAILPVVVQAIDKSIQPDDKPGRLFVVFRLSGMHVQVIIDDNGIKRMPDNPLSDQSVNVNFADRAGEGNRVEILL